MLGHCPVLGSLAVLDGESPWLCTPVLGSALSTWHRELCSGISDHVVWETLHFRVLKNGIPEMPSSWEAEQLSSCGPHRPPPELETREIEPGSLLGLLCPIQHVAVVSCSTSCRVWVGEKWSLGQDAVCYAPGEYCYLLRCSYAFVPCQKYYRSEGY